VRPVAPVFLKDPVWIEGLLCCHSVALAVQDLVERPIRTVMAGAGTEAIPLHPKERGCGSPSAPRVFQILSGVVRHHLQQAGKNIQAFDPELGTDLQGQVLDLLGVPRSADTDGSTSGG